MKKNILLIVLLFIAANSFAQENNTIKGTVMNDADDKLLENVNIVNLNQVKGTTTNEKGGGGWSLLIFNTKVAVLIERTHYY